MRYATKDGGWRVDVISIDLPTDNYSGDNYYGGHPPAGESLRVTQNGYWVADVTRVEDLAATGVPVAELEEVK